MLEMADVLAGGFGPFPVNSADFYSGLVELLLNRQGRACAAAGAAAQAHFDGCAVAMTTRAIANAGRGESWVEVPSHADRPQHF